MQFRSPDRESSDTDPLFLLAINVFLASDKDYPFWITVVTNQRLASISGIHQVICLALGHAGRSPFVKNVLNEMF